MELISNEYKQVLIKEHQISNWGEVGFLYKDFIIQKCKELKVNNLLDYGCGQGLLKKTLESIITVTNYDPGIAKWSALPSKHEVVVCADVLEHVEENYVENVIKHIHSVTGSLLLVTVSVKQAVRVLNNGQNAHITIKDINWWEEKILKYFNIVSIEHGNMYVLEPKQIN